MKKNYLWSYSLVALFLLFTACNTSTEDEVMPDSNKVNIEPDFFEKDGSLEESDMEEEAPTGVDQKTYGYYRNYTLLKPSEVSQEKIDGMCGEATTMSLLVGSKKKKVGEVKVTNDDENLYLTFTADQGKYMKKVYLNIGAKGSTPFYSNGFPNLRKFNFKAFPYYYGGMKKATYVIPLSDIDIDCFEIVAYSKVYDKNSRCLYTSFAYDENLTQTYSYSYYSGCYYYNEWVRSFEYCKKECNDEYIDVFAKKLDDEVVECVDFLINGDAYNAWSTYVLHNWLLGVTQNNSAFELPMYIKEIDDCNTPQTTHLGHVEYSLADNLQDIKIKYVLRDEFKNEYSIEKINLYVGTEINPYNEDGSYKTGIVSANFYSGDFVEDNNIIIPWTSNDPYAQVNIIPHAKVSKIEN